MKVSQVMSPSGYPNLEREASHVRCFIAQKGCAVNEKVCRLRSVTIATQTSTVLSEILVNAFHHGPSSYLSCLS